MRRLVITLSVVLAGLIVGCSASPTTSAPAGTATAQASVRQLDPAEFASASSAGRVVINVHTPDQGSLPDTDLAVPFDQLKDRATELPPEKTTPLAIYCMTGDMSAIAGQTLLGLGYTDIVELRGGMMAWAASGRPLIPVGG